MHKKDTNILIVDDRPENIFVIESILEDLECNIIKATSGNEALSKLLEYDFALVLLDVQMPEMDGFETAELMRGSAKTRDIPIIFVTAISKERRCIFMGYELGAVDYLFKPIEPVILKSKVNVFIELYNQKMRLKEQAMQLEQKIKELLDMKEMNNRLESLSTLDGLTGIPNRRSFDQYMEMNWKDSIRNKKPITLIMIDIDNFKLYNDNYGHLKGDDCLIKVANILVNSLKRPMDFAARYGGEEFGVILPSTNLEGGITIGEMLRESVEQLKIKHEHSTASDVVTISLGVSSIIPNSLQTIDEFIHASDKALYKAKKEGKNTVMTIESNTNIKVLAN